MKKLNLLLSTIFILSISSCSSDENESQNLIVGIWKQVKSVEVCSTGNETINDLAIGCNKNSSFSFNENGEFNLKTYYDYYVDENGVEQINTNCEKFIVSNGTWNLKENELTININNEPMVFNFIKISSEKLEMGSYDSNSNNSCDGNGNVSHYYTEYERIE
jgi:hypothetical protein